VTDRDAIRIALGAYGELLAYPSQDLRPAIARALARVSTRTARPLHPFAEWAIATPAAAREELYGTTFDLDPVCAPYVGHHLCGESPVRGLFLARLAGVYAAHGFAAPQGELPDHLAIVLRFVARAHGKDRDDLVTDGLVPAVAKMREALRGRPNPYRQLLTSLARLLAEAEEASRAAAPLARAEEVTP
jgi:nitrate reductase delta subunit